MVAPSEFQRILQAIAAWPEQDRVKLVAALVHIQEPVSPPPRPRMSELLGIARGSGPAPTDEEVKQWIHEHRMEKYGK